MYSVYMKDSHYKNFINVLNDSLLKKKNNFRFLSGKNPQLDLNSIFDDVGREKIKRNFVDNLSSKEFADEVKKEYAEYKHRQEPELRKIDQKVQDFYNEREREIMNDEKAKKVTHKFLDTIHNFSEKHKDEYKYPGILTLDGGIETNPIKYIKKEEELVKEKYKSETYTIEDIDQLMKIDNLLK